MVRPFNKKQSCFTQCWRVHSDRCTLTLKNSEVLNTLKLNWLQPTFKLFKLHWMNRIFNFATLFISDSAFSVLYYLGVLMLIPLSFSYMNKLWTQSARSICSNRLITLSFVISPVRVLTELNHFLNALHGESWASKIGLDNKAVTITLIEMYDK